MIQSRMQEWDSSRRDRSRILKSDISLNEREEFADTHIGNLEIVDEIKRQDDQDRLLE